MSYIGTRAQNTIDKHAGWRKNGTCRHCIRENHIVDLGLFATFAFANVAASSTPTSRFHGLIAEFIFK